MLLRLLSACEIEPASSRESNSISRFSLFRLFALLELCLILLDVVAVGANWENTGI